jgi:hypothetical protein
MIAKIDFSGHLMILRGGSFQKQYCPYTLSVGCGDWCPLFGEPSPVYDGEETGKESAKIMQLCRVNIIAYLDDGENIVDERPERGLA